MLWSQRIELCGATVATVCMVLLGRARHDGAGVS